MGGVVPDSRINASREHFNEVVSRTCLNNVELDRALALSGNLISHSLTDKSARHGVFYVGAVRMLDFITHPSPGVRMPVTVVVITISLGLLFINPSDWVGEVKGALAVLVPVLLYWWKQKREREEKEDLEQHETHESILNYNADKERRLEDRATALRLEERQFMHSQMELSRRRGHILARGYMAVEMANDRLIELLRDNKVDVPKSLLTYQTRALILGELKELKMESKSNQAESEQDEPHH